MRRFEGAAVLVTGASSGIGRACAQRLASEGARVALWARDAHRLESTVASLANGPHLWSEVDVTNEASTKAAVVGLRAAGTKLRLVVHAAGIHALRPLMLESPENLSSMLDANVGSVFRLTRLCLAAGLFEAKSSVVAISSQAATRATPGASAYSASKGALESAIRTWAVELAGRGVRVNAVSPGVVRSPMTDRLFASLTGAQQREIESRHLLGLGEPEDVAASVAFLGSDDARWITGTVLAVDGGFSA